MANDDGLHVRAARLTGASARIRHQIGGGIPPELTGRWGDPAGGRSAGPQGEIDYDRARAEGYAMDTDAAVAYAHDISA